MKKIIILITVLVILIKGYLNIDTIIANLSLNPFMHVLLFLLVVHAVVCLILKHKKNDKGKFSSDIKNIGPFNILIPILFIVFAPSVANIATTLYLVPIVWLLVSLFAFSFELEIEIKSKK